jgi:type II secretory pathway pseudopilin PulG
VIRRSDENGFSLLALLILVATIGIVSAATVQTGALLERRAAEDHLLSVGEEFTRAFASYAAVSPPGQPRAPAKLEDLVRDPRFPGARRHLRQVYVDPITRKPDWGRVVAPDGRIVAVYSLSELPVIRQTASGAWNVSIDAANRTVRYMDWQFGMQTARSTSQRNER